MQLNRQMCLKVQKTPPLLHHPEQRTGHHASPIHNTRAGHPRSNQTVMLPTNKHVAGDEANWSTTGTECTYPARTSILLHGTHSTLPLEIRQNVYQLRALCLPNGSPDHWTKKTSYKNRMHNPATA